MIWRRSIGGCSEPLMKNNVTATNVERILCRDDIFAYQECNYYTSNGCGCTGCSTVLFSSEEF